MSVPNGVKSLTEKPSIQLSEIENKKNAETLSKRVGKLALPLILLTGIALTAAASLAFPTVFLPAVPLAFKCITLGTSALAIYSLLADNSEYIPMEEALEEGGCEEEELIENKETLRSQELAEFLKGVNLKEHASVGARK